MKQAHPHNEYEMRRQAEDQLARSNLLRKLPDGYDARQEQELLKTRGPSPAFVMPEVPEGLKLNVVPEPAPKEEPSVEG